jgi:hypothetical protein
MKRVMAVFFLLLLPFSYALDCNDIIDDNLELCNEIIGSSASHAEKQELIANIVYQESYKADHDQVYDWNTGISFNQAPDSVSTSNSGYIKDAWVKIIGVYPSVLSEEILYTPGLGKIQTEYDYRIEIPDGTESGDCKTLYYLDEEDYWLKIYKNGNQIGTSRLVSYNGPGTINFKSTLQIKIVTRVKHYEKEKYCCKKEDGSCVKYCYSCEYDNAEYRTHEINIEDNLQTQYYWKVILPEIKAVDRYHETTAGILEINDFDSFQLDFEDSYFNQYNYYYDVDVSLEPYDVLTIRANEDIVREEHNINIEDESGIYKFYVNNYDGCLLTFSDHFHTWSHSCELETDFPEFSITTDKLQYSEEELILVDIEPKDTEVKIQYDDIELSAINNVELQAKQGQNKIIAAYENRVTDHVIHVKNKNTWAFVMNFSVFSGVMYSMYLALKKYWSVIL